MQSETKLKAKQPLVNKLLGPVGPSSGGKSELKRGTTGISQQIMNNMKIKALEISKV